MLPLSDRPAADTRQTTTWQTPTVRSVMTPRPVAVRQDTPYQDILLLLRRHHIDAVPVLDAFGEPVGVVSETDLVAMRPHQAGDHTPLLGSSRQRRLRGNGGLQARDLMTVPAHTVDADAPLAAVAEQLAHAPRRRLLVTSRGQLVGVVAQSDLWRVFDRPDTDLQADVALALRRAAPASPVAVSVDDGVVTLLGVTPKRSTKTYLEMIAAEVAGVVAVHNRLRYTVDDR